MKKSFCYSHSSCCADMSLPSSISYSQVSPGSPKLKSNGPQSSDPDPKQPQEAQELCSISSCYKFKVLCWVSILIVVIVLIGTFVTYIIHLNSKPPHPAECAGCPTDWIQLNSRCYYLSDIARDWNASEKFCNNHEASLLIMRNDTKKDLDKLNTRGDFWIGLRRDQNKWKWVDGTDYDGVVEGYQKDRQLHCTYQSEGIRVLDCSTSRRFICSKTARGLLS